MLADRLFGRLVSIAAMLATACGESRSDSEPAPDAGVIDPPDGGGAPPVDPETGPGDLPCAPGELVLEGGGCAPAGVGTCGRGFAADGDGGCEAILPRAACAPGTMAIPGETTCREVGPCAPGTWGDIPIGASSQFVDAAYTGGASDGTQAAPWTTLQPAIDAALPGAIVALAEGTYPGDVIVTGKPVRIWGRCPLLVSVVGDDTLAAAVDVGAGADGTELRDLAITGASAAVSVQGAVDVLADRVWIHDTPHGGLRLVDSGGPTAAALRRSLVEGVAVMGVFAWGATAHVEESVVRGTLPATALDFGRGVNVASDPSTGVRAELTLTRSIVEGSHEWGVIGWGSDVAIESTLVRDTFPSLSDQELGRGVEVRFHVESGERGALSLRGSIVERCHDMGVHLRNSDGSAEDTVVRDVEPEASTGDSGMGILVSGTLPPPAPRPTFTLQRAVVERTHFYGAAAAGAHATIEGVIVRDVSTRRSDGVAGRGVGAELDPDTLQKGNLVLRGSRVERTHEGGVFVAASDAVIEQTAIRDTGPRLDGTFGRGITVELHPASMTRASALVLASIIERSYEAGITVIGSDVTIDQTIVRDTQSREAGGLFGRGIDVEVDAMGGSGARSTAQIRRSIVEDTRDMGVLVLGSDVEIEATAIRRTAPRAVDGMMGRGVAVQISTETFEPSSLVLSRSIVEDSYEMGVYVGAAEATLEDVVVRRTKAQEASGELGDGVLVLSLSYGAEEFKGIVSIERSRIEQSARAAVSNFEGQVSVGDSALTCNPLDLDGESESAPPAYEFDDLGGNVCGCADEVHACQVLSTGLAPPIPL